MSSNSARRGRKQIFPNKAADVKFGHVKKWLDGFLKDEGLEISVDDKYFEGPLTVCEIAWNHGAELHYVFETLYPIAKQFSLSRQVRDWEELANSVLPAIQARADAMAALNRVNASRKRSPSQAAKVRRLYADLQNEFPKDAPRFREIAKRLDLTTHQVRHILKPSKRKPRR